jgi:putative CocE/NonD family hydrolase
MWRKLTPERRSQCALVVTPFEHGYDPKNVKPELQDFAEDGSLRAVAPDLCYDWFDHFRTGKALDFAARGKTVYYRLWDNKWVTADELANASESKVFYLDTERRLSPDKSADGEICYIYNPYDPAPFAGGVCNNFGGVIYQDKPNSRFDIISFISEPQECELVCEGRIEVELHCKSTAEDSCFYIRLDLVRDDKVIPLRDDIDSIRRHVPEYRAGEKCIIRYTLAPHAFKMLPGDRLRLDVSSSCVPHFQVHTNQPGLQAAFKTARSCRNTIITGNSFIRLFVRN